MLMRHSRLYLLALVVVLAACKTAVNTFEESDALTRSYYARVMPNTCLHKLIASDSSSISRITVFKTSFNEKRIDAGSLLTVASINKSSTRPTISYKPILGYRQD